MKSFPFLALAVLSIVMLVAMPRVRQIAYVFDGEKLVAGDRSWAVPASALDPLLFASTILGDTKRAYFVSTTFGVESCRATNVLYELDLQTQQLRELWRGATPDEMCDSLDLVAKSSKTLRFVALPSDYGAPCASPVAERPDRVYEINLRNVAAGLQYVALSERQIANERAVQQRCLEALPLTKPSKYPRVEAYEARNAQRIPVGRLRHARRGFAWAIF